MYIKNKKFLPCILHFFSILLLLLFSVPYVIANENQVAFFRDDFEDGKFDLWKLDPGWEVKQDAIGNHFMSAKGHRWATYTDKENRIDYSLKTNLKIIQGGVQLHYRMSGLGRYIVLFRSDIVTLSKESPLGERHALIARKGHFSTKVWHTVEIKGQRGHITVLVDGVSTLLYHDIRPLPGAFTAVECLPKSSIDVDDVTLLISRPAGPLTNIWVPTGGPSGGTGYDIRIYPRDKEILFVTDNPSGVNKSIDGGKSWKQKNEGIITRYGSTLDGIPIFSLTIDPNHPDTIWAGTQNSKGIYRSTNCGETWTKKDSGVVEGGDTLSFRGFAIRPGNSNTVIAAGQVQTQIMGKTFNKSRGVIYKTTDFGEYWRRVLPAEPFPLHNRFVSPFMDSLNSLARIVIFDPVNPDIVYCSTGIFDAEALNSNKNINEPGGEGILKSTDGGEHWFRVNNGLLNKHIGFLEMDPKNHGTLYAAAHCGAYMDVNLGGLYKTTNGGDYWQLLKNGNSPLSDGFTLVTISPSDPNVVYAGSQGAFYRSDNAGLKWNLYTTRGPEPNWGPPGVMAGFPISAAVDPDSATKVFVNNYAGGNFVSTNGGKSWSNSSRGYSGANIRVIKVDPLDPYHVYLTGRSGPFRTTNGGDDWSGMAFDYGMYIIYTLAVFPDVPSHLLGAGDDFFKIVKSTNGGNSWFEVTPHGEVLENVDTQHNYFATIAIAPSNPDVVYAGTRKTYLIGAIDPAPDPSIGIFISTDRGSTWTIVNNGINESVRIINALAVHPLNPDIVYAGTYTDGIYKTTDGGNHWIRMMNGFAATDIRSIAIDPVSPEIVYAGSAKGDGIFKTTNGGDSWEEANTGLRLECPQYLRPLGRNLVGSSLERPTSIGPVSLYYNIPWTLILSIVIDPTNPNRLYACDLCSGVYVSEDGGHMWTIMNNGLTNKAIHCLGLSSDGQFLYAASEGAGVFRMLMQHPNQIRTP